MSSDINVLFLSMADILRVGFNLDDALEAVTDSLTEHGKKRVENPPKQPIHPMPDAFINAMPGFLSERDACGLKWVAGFPANTAKSLPTITGVMIINDPETGFPLSFMDATYITAIRTVAVSVVSAKHFCNANTQSMGLVGCGVQGKYHAVAMKSILPELSTIKVYDVWEPAIERFISEVRADIPDVEILAQNSPESAIRDTELVITATGRLLKPIFDSQWIKQGGLVLPVHTMGWDSAIVSRMDKLFTDDWEQFLSVGRKCYQPLPDKPSAETGEVVAGLKPGRETEDERIVCFNKGLAIHDVLIGKKIFEKAKAMGIGENLEVQAANQELPKLKIGQTSSEKNSV